MTGADLPSNGSSCSSGDHNNSGKKKKRKSSAVTVVMTDLYNFRAKVQKFTAMPTPPAYSTAEESQKIRCLLLKPKAQRAVINAPPSTLPFLSSVLRNSTNSCNPTFTDNLLKLPIIQSDHPVEAQKSNSLLLPTFSGNRKSSNTISLLFEELLEEFERTENAAM